MSDQRTLSEFTVEDGSSEGIRNTADYHVNDGHAYEADPDTSPTLCGSPLPAGRFHVVLDPTYYQEVSSRNNPLTPGVYLWHNATADFQDAPSEVAASDTQLRKAVEAAWEAIVAICDDVGPVVGFNSGVRWSSLNIHMSDRDRGNQKRIHRGYLGLACPEPEQETVLEYGFASIRLFGTPVDTLVYTPDPRLDLGEIGAIEMPTS